MSTSELRKIYGEPVRRDVLDGGRVREGTRGWHATVGTGLPPPAIALETTRPIMASIRPAASVWSASIAWM